MKLIVDISEEQYELVRHGNKSYTTELELMNAVAKGTPLPKGHGKLIDIGKIDNDKMEADNPIIYLTINGEYIEAVSLDYLNDLPTIIEADEEVKKNEDSD